MSSQIHHYSHNSEQKEFLNNEKKLRRLLLQKKKFEKYQQNKKFPEGSQMKFELVLCCDDKNLKGKCTSILKSA